MSTAVVARGLTAEQKLEYEADGCTVLRGVFSPAECDAYIAHFMDVHAERISFPGVESRRPDDWGRWHNAHHHDPVALELLLHPRLRQPLEDLIDAEVDGIQTMYFWKGSEQTRHQDRYYIPECFSAWIALMDVSPENGTLYVQKGSHRGRLLTMQDFRQPNGEPMPMFGRHYDDAVDALSAENGLPESPVRVGKGDVLLFHGKLIHRGGPILRAGSFRHVMANHYIPHASRPPGFDDYPRYGFDGSRRTIAAATA